MAGQNVGNLSVKLSADGAAFKSGLDAASRHAESWSKKVGGFVKGALPAIGVGVLAGQFRQIIEEMDNVGDNATRAGLEVKDFMNVIGTLDSEDTMLATEALKKLRKSMAQAASGDKETLEKFSKAGMDGQALSMDKLGNSLKRIANIWASTEDPLKRFNIEFAAFGKAGVEVSAVLDKLAKSQDGANRFAGLNPEKFDDMKRAMTELENRWFNFKARAAQAMIDPVGGGGDMSDPRWWLPSFAPKSWKLREFDDPTALFKQNQTREIQDDINRRKNEREARLFGNSAGSPHVRERELAEAAKFASERSRISALMGANNWGRSASRAVDFGEMVKNKIQPFMDSISGTSATMGRGSQEEASFRAKFEQSQMGVKTSQEQMVAMYKQALEAEKKTAAATEKLAAAVIQRMPNFGVVSLGGF